MIWTCLVGVMNVDRGAKRRPNKQLQAQRTAFHLNMTVALYHHLGGKIKVVKPTRIGTVVECSRVE